MFGDFVTHAKKHQWSRCVVQQHRCHNTSHLRFVFAVVVVVMLVIVAGCCCLCVVLLLCAVVFVWLLICF